MALLLLNFVKQYKSKECLKCKIIFIPTSPKQKYCGSVLKKVGCSLIRYNEFQKNRKRIRTLKVIQREKEYRKTHPPKNCSRATPKSFYGKYRIGSTYRKIDFLLSFEDFLETVNKPCAYCGENEKIGIDRVNNNIGYVVGNVVPCCKWCNRMKGTMDKDSFINQCKKVSHFL